MASCRQWVVSVVPGSGSDCPAEATPPGSLQVPHEGQEAGIEGFQNFLDGSAGIVGSREAMVPARRSGSVRGQTCAIPHHHYHHECFSHRIA